MLQRIAVAFGGGGDKNSGFVRFGKFQKLHGGQGIDLEGLNLVLDVADGRGGGGQMPDAVEPSVHV